MSDFPQEFQEEESICRSMHHLSTAAHHQPSAAIKRPSHLSPSSSHEPSSKRANVNPDSPPSAADAGYTKLPLPLSLPVAPWPSLSRTSSEPIKYTTAAVNNVQQPSPKLSEVVPTSSSPALNPPPPSFPFPSLCRTVSDPSPLGNHPTPPRPPHPRNSSGSPSIGDSPSTKRLKRMKERMKEMSEWVNQVVSEGEEEDRETENYNSTDSVLKDESESHEAVWVEKNGDSLVLHFKCPCGNGYQILLFGNTCYYKLTSF